MPPPAPYTEATLASYLVGALTDVGTVLGWTEDSWPVLEAVTDTALALGVTDVSTVADVAAVRAVGAVMIWRRAVAALAARTSFRTGQFTTDQQQQFAHAREVLNSLETAASSYLPAYSVQVSGVRYIHDPYAAIPDAARTL